MKKKLLSLCRKCGKTEWKKETAGKRKAHTDRRAVGNGNPVEGRKWCSSVGFKSGGRRITTPDQGKRNNS